MISWHRGDRRVVVHYHVYKNAGTSVDEFLQETFGPSWVAFDRGTNALKPSDAAEFLSNRPEIEAISSHLLRPPAPEEWNVFPIALIRHPLDRAYSCYSHSRQGEPVFESMTVARRTDFPGYVSWCLDHSSEGGVVIVNYQTIHFSSASFRYKHVFDATACKSDLDEALQLVHSLPAIGVVDDFEKYFERLCEKLSEFLGRRIEAKPRRANASLERRQLPLGENVAALSDLLGPALLERFIGTNWLDYQLYEQVMKASRSAS